MRPAFRLATFLWLLFALLVYFGAGSTGMLGHSPGVLGATATSSSGCTSAYTLSASDPYSWSSTSIADICSWVNFTVINTGSNAHTFTVSNIDNGTAASEGVGYFAPGSLYYNEPLPGGATLTATIHFNASGAYEFTCIPHYTLGMHGEIYVNEAAPGAGPAAPNFQPFWYIVAVVGTLAVAAVVGGLVYGKAGAESTALEPGGPITSHPEYYNDSRPDPLDSAEPMKRGGDGDH